MRDCGESGANRIQVQDQRLATMELRGDAFNALNIAGYEIKANSAAPLQPIRYPDTNLIDGFLSADRFCLMNCGPAC